MQYDWPYRWESLSFGERRRAQLAGLLYRAPDLLVLDEPTNHLDIAALEVLGRSLALYSGIGVLISHDRTLLDRLCSQTLFVADGQVAARPGGVSAGLAQAERERSGLLRERRAAQAEVERVRRERSSRRALAASQQSRRSKRGLAPKDHDGRARRDLARVSGRDGVGGKLLRQMDGRLAQAEERLAALDVRGEQKSGVTLYGAPAEKDLLLRYGPGRVPLGQERSLDVPLLEMKPADRIALTGPNGSGKSTLLRALLSSAPALPATVMPQELGAADIARLLAKLGALSNDERGRLLSTVSRLGSDPERLISAAALSPGEARKLLLAFGMAEEVPLIVLDEPTNHMDLPSVIALTAALRDYRGGLLVATHDRVLAAELTSTAWRIGPGRSAAELALTAGPAE